MSFVVTLHLTHLTYYYQDVGYELSKRQTYRYLYYAHILPK